VFVITQCRDESGDAEHLCHRNGIYGFFCVRFDYCLEFRFSTTLNGSFRILMVVFSKCSVKIDGGGVSDA
jgi:hypothetical protein